MPKIIAIDSVSINRLQVLKNDRNEIQVYAEYELRSGSDLIQLLHKDVTGHLTTGAKATASVMLETIAREIAASELA